MTADDLLDIPIGQALRDAAAEMPDRTALVAGVPDPADRRRWSYAELLSDAERTARGLLTRFRPGDRIALWAPNIPEWVQLYYGVALAGMTLVTVNPAYRPEELRFVLQRSGARAVFLVPEYRTNPMAQSLAGVRQELPDLTDVVLLTEFEEFLGGAHEDVQFPTVDPHGPMALMYTSGTTGEPKGALQHHYGMLNNARCVARSWMTAEHEINVNPVPFFHAGGCILAILGALTTRATLVSVGQFDPGVALALVEEERATSLAGVPTMFIAMAEHPDFAHRDLSTLRALGSGGATLAAPVLHHLEDSLGVPCINVFGQTECVVATMTTLDDSFDDRADTVGRALPGVEVETFDENGRPTRELGEIRVRGYPVMLGYDGLPEATADAIDANGWLHTGDLGTLDERGYLRVEGRIKDMVIRGGENIYPREIEALLITDPTVGDVAVIGVPDDRWGEQLAAYVRPAPGQTPDFTALAALVRAHLAHYKVPVYWEIVDEFPLTPSGKVKKFELRNRWIRDVSRASGGPR